MVSVRDRLMFRPPRLGTALFLPGLPGGGASIYDRSIYKNNGAITGATYARLPSGLPYLDFDAATEKVDLGTTGILTLTSGTVLFWFKCPLTVLDNMILSASDKDTNAVDEWQLNAKGGVGWDNISFVTRTASANVQQLQTAEDTIVANQWTQCAIVSSGTAISMYLQGVSKAITIGVGVNNGDWFGDVPNLDNLTLGLLRRSLGDVAPFVGGQTLLRATSEILTDAQIMRHYIQEKHLFRV